MKDKLLINGCSDNFEEDEVDCWFTSQKNLKVKDLTRRDLYGLVLHEKFLNKVQRHTVEHLERVIKQERKRTSWKNIFNRSKIRK